MAPNSFDSTTTSTKCYTYSVSTTDTYWADPTLCSEDTTSYRWHYVYTITGSSKVTEAKVKKLLKKMVGEMCKNGWINHIPYYSEPKPIPVSLRGVRFDGRGWANL